MLTSGVPPTGVVPGRIAPPAPGPLLDQLPSAVVVADDGGAVVYANRRAEAMFGPAGGRDLAEHGVLPTEPAHQQAVWETLERDGRWEGDHDFVAAGGHTTRLHAVVEHLEDPAWGFSGLIATAVDVSASKAVEDRIRDLAYVDQLTGLPNQLAVAGLIERALAASEGREHRVAVLAVDLDDFRSINDTYGLEAGDALIEAVAARIGELIGPRDVLARRTGDGFIVCMPAVPGPEQAMETAAAMLRAFSLAYALGSGTVRLSATIGVAVSERGDTDRKLMQEADIAMFEAKEAGKRRALLFDDTRRLHRLRVRRIAASLEHGLAAGEIVNWYQPVVSLPGGQLVGFEALVRWDHPQSGLLPPAQFIPVAEETGLIEQLGARVLAAALADLAAWPAAAGAEPLTTAVNVSGRQLRCPDFAGSVRAALAAAGVDASRLCLEVTETDLGDSDTERIAAGLESLRAIGVRIAIDDFGTGHSCLDRLRQLPVDYLKIDRSFVASMLGDTGSRAIVAAVVGLASAIGLETIGEGVEEPAQAEALHAMGCRVAQGFNWSRPVPAGEAAAMAARAAEGRWR